MNKLKPEELDGCGGRLVDVRNLDEFAHEHLEAAQCVPLGKLLSEAGPWERGERIVLTCKSGRRATEGAMQLEQAGFTDVCVVEGGLEGCKRAGLKVVSVTKRIPLQQQVMIVVGCILLVGLVLSLRNPWFLLIDWFVALGLIVGGLTGVCLMATVLSHMPWNKVPMSTCCSRTTGGGQ